MNSKPTPHTVKERKTRRRLRLSCTECVQRRQKCDRKFPCGLCVSRNVSHLCRWESVPVARVPPQRPPHLDRSQTSDHDQQVNTLNARVAELEKSVAEYQQKLSAAQAGASHAALPSASLWLEMPDSPATYSSSSYSSESHLPLDMDNDSSFTFRPLHTASYDTALSLAQVSLGHFGDYLGKGTIVDTIRSMRNSNAPISHTPITLFPFTTSQSYHHPSSLGFQKLLQFIPSPETCSLLVEGYIETKNWKFGIPPTWLRSLVSQICSMAAFQFKTSEPVNPNATALLFAVLALAPHGDDTGEIAEQYFMCGMAALRLATHNPSSTHSTSGSEGQVMGCVAVPILCQYLVSRGNLNDAWKLTGQWLRIAQSIGLHRDLDPSAWGVLTTEERILRRRAWWSLCCCDVLHSFILGRPAMFRQEYTDAALPSFHSELSDDFGQHELVWMSMINLSSEVMAKCMGAQVPTQATLLELDSRLVLWESRLPPTHRMLWGEALPADFLRASSFLFRVQLTSFYLMLRLKIHMILQASGNVEAKRHWQGRCISLAEDVIRLQCDIESADSAMSPEFGHHCEAILFERSWSLLDAAVTLLCLRQQQTWSRESEGLVQRAIGWFQTVLSTHGTSFSAAVGLLQLLVQDSVWKTADYQDSGPRLAFGAEYPWEAAPTTAMAGGAGF